MTSTFYTSSRVTLTAVLCLATSACGDCGGDNNNTSPDDASATITIDMVSPEFAFASNPSTFAFTISPTPTEIAQELSWSVDFGDGNTASGQGIMNTEVEHTYMFGGSFQVKVEASHNGEVIGEVTTERVIYEPADLALGAVRGQPANIEAGESLEAFGTLTNKLAADFIPPVTLSAYLGTSPATDLDSLDMLTPIGEALIEPLTSDRPNVGAGQDREVSFSVTLPSDIASGDYYLTLVADANEEIIDQDRSDNLATGATALRVVNATQIEPDLITTGVIAAPDRAFPELNSFTRSVTLQNNGGLDLFDVVVETYLSEGDATLDDQDRLVHTSSPIDQITARGGMAELEATTIILDQAISPPPDSSLNVYVIAKAFSRDANVSESDEDNNILAADAPILVTDQPVDGPDIVVRDFQISPERTFINGSLSYSLDVANEGTSDVASFLCRIYLADEPRVDTLRDQPVDSINIPNLASGGTRQIEDSITVSELFDPGTYYMYVLCDPNDLLGEPFRSNNQSIYPNPLIISRESDVDLSVRSLSVPKNAIEGETITLDLEVCTTGANASGVTRAALYRTPGNRVDFNAEPLRLVDIPNINPNECLIVPIQVDTVCEQFQPNYAFGIVLDANDALPENDESNNARTGDNILELTGTFCTCMEDMFEPNDRPIDAKDLPSGLTPLALCAQGSCDFFRTETLIEGDSLLVTNTHDPAQGVLATRIFDPTGIQALDLDRSDDGVQEVANFLGAGGAYIIEVCGSQAGTRNLYELEVNVKPPSATVDLLARKVTLPPRSSFSIGAQFDVGFDLYNLGQLASGPFNVEVRISADTTIDANDPLLGSKTITDLVGATQVTEQIPVTIPTSLNDGTYYIGVWIDPAMGLAESDTTNNIATSSSFEVITLCYDPLEPNDSFDEAYPVTASSTFSNLIACTSGDDYYEICAGNGKRIAVSTTFTHANGDLDLRLYDAQRVRIADSSTQNDTERVEIPYVNGAQCYIARVSMVNLPGQMAAENLYDLAIEIEDVDPALLCNSYGEPNNSFNEATSLIAASQTQIIDRCPQSDTDFFFFDVGAVGQMFSIDVSKDPIAQPGTLRMQLYNPSQTPDINDETAPDQPTASISNYVAPQAGRYWVQITATGNARNITYDISLTGLTGVDLAPENLVIGPGTYAPGEMLRIGFDLRNFGSDPTPMPPEFTLLFGDSPIPNPMLDIDLGGGSAFAAPGNVTGNGSRYVFVPTNVPNGLPPGTYYIHLLVDDLDDINPGNNIASIPVVVQ